MKRFLLDTSALLTLRNDESGSERVAELFALQAKGKAEVSACFVTLYEILYRVWKNEGEHIARSTYDNCQTLPIQWINQSPTLLESAARIKALNQLSAMDAWVAASALQMGAILVHKDPEFSTLKMAQEVLPLKVT